MSLDIPSPETSTVCHGDLEAQFGGLLLKEQDLLLAVSLLVVFSAFVHVFLPILEHSIADTAL
jgi:hypothetical protein